MLQVLTCGCVEEYFESWNKPKSLYRSKSQTVPHLASPLNLFPRSPNSLDSRYLPTTPTFSLSHIVRWLGVCLWLPPHYQITHGLIIHSKKCIFTSRWIHWWAQTLQEVKRDLGYNLNSLLSHNTISISYKVTSTKSTIHQPFTPFLFPTITKVIKTKPIHI